MAILSTYDDDDSVMCHCWQYYCYYVSYYTISETVYVLLENLAITDFMNALSEYNWLSVSMHFIFCLQN